MNLIEARKLGHEGWVRSPTCTLGQWCRATQRGFETENGFDGTPLNVKDLDAEDWEPKPAPAKPFEDEVWVSKHGVIDQVSKTVRDENSYLKTGWRRIRVREVTE